MSKEEGGAERRESLRVPMRMMARPYDREDFIACDGDISLGGARVRLPSAPSDKQIEVLLSLPQPYGELRLQGEIIDSFPAAKGGVVVRVKFVEHEFLDELALARLLDDVSSEWDDWTGEIARST